MVSCQDNFVNELKIRGDKLVDVSGFSGYAIHNKTLSEKFSIDSLVTTLTTDKVNQFKIFPDFSTLTRLRVLDVKENRFGSKLPAMPQGLVTALLAKNLFSGEIPPQVGISTHLQHIDLSFNHLSGTPPPLCLVRFA
ncbi:hypothetical protein V6N12_036947 [Hibiscus sabdariffa]|uniref:Uncharacterized protein n=1 Tax=Hibiscus sabdariffa TaxID=183260 RepID=A0ABR1ZS52_9ROSI